MARAGNSKLLDEGSIPSTGTMFTLIQRKNND